jgi:acetyltransferase
MVMPMPERDLPPAAQPECLVLADGTAVVLRGIRPEDAAIEQAFVRRLSPRSRQLRFLSGVRELTPAMLARFTNTEYPHEAAFIATIERDGRERQIGVARFAPGSSASCREFAVVVGDEWQGRGIASALLRKLFRVAVDAGTYAIEGVVLRENARMLGLARDFGFEIRPHPDDPALVAVHKAL